MMKVFDWPVDASASCTVGQIGHWRNNRWPHNALQYHGSCQSAITIKIVSATGHELTQLMSAIAMSRP